MAKIGLEKIEFYAFHGYSAEERKVGCRFELDVTIDLDLDRHNWQDSIEKTVNYENIYQICKSEMKTEQRLIETVALRIINKLKSLDPKINKVSIKLKKLDPPIHGHIRNAFVELEL